MVIFTLNEQIQNLGFIFLPLRTIYLPLTSQEEEEKKRKDKNQLIGFSFFPCLKNHKSISNGTV